MFIRGRGMTVSRVLVTLMAIGVLSSCIYGMTRVNPHLVAQGLSVVDSVKVRGLAPCGRPSTPLGSPPGWLPNPFADDPRAFCWQSTPTGRQTELTMSCAGVVLANVQVNRASRFALCNDKSAKGASSCTVLQQGSRSGCCPCLALRNSTGGSPQP